MSAIRTNNPMLTAAAFEPQGRFGNFELGAKSNTMTVQGTVNASLVLMGICVASAIAVWTFLAPTAGQMSPLLFPVVFGGAILSTILCFVCCMKPTASPYLGWLIAAGEGCLAGGLSILWTMYAEGARSGRGGIGQSLGSGLVLQATLLTGGVAGAMLIAYKTRLIQATEKFKVGVIAATGGLFFLCIASMVLGFFGVHIPYIWGNGPIGIAFAGFVVVLAAMNLVLDFDFIEQGAENSLPKHMEWYGAIGLLVTLVWLYVSILRLLAKLQSRR